VCGVEEVHVAALAAAESRDLAVFR
jgi:hypothetical protein